MVGFQYGQMHNYYYYGRHAVDDNNNNRQGCLSFEDIFVPKTWELRQLGFIIALVQTNTYLFYNYARSNSGLEEVCKAEFVRELCKEMMENEDYKKAKDIYEKETLIRRKRVEDYELCKIPAGRGKWNGGFP